MEAVFTHTYDSLRGKRFQKKVGYISSRRKTPSLTGRLPVLSVLRVEINKDTGLSGRERVRGLGTTTVLLFNVTFPQSSRRRRRRLSRDEIKLQSKISSSPPRFEITTLQKWNCRELTNTSVKPRNKRERKQKQTKDLLTKRQKERPDWLTLRSQNQPTNR